MRSTPLLLQLSQHSRRSTGQRRRARKAKRNDGINAAANKRDLSAGLPLDCIVSRLPLRQRVQMMCVCKAWYCILRDCVAADLAELQKGPWLLMARYCHETGWKLMAYGEAGLQAFSIPFLRHENLSVTNGSYEGMLMGCPRGDYFPDFWKGKLLGCSNTGCSGPEFENPRLASSGGLMCGLLSADPHHIKGVVTVFNCLTGAFKLLPPPLRSDLLFSKLDLYDPVYCLYPSPCYIYMAVDDLDPMRYYIMLTRVVDVCYHYFFRPQRHMEVFDSKTGSWKDVSFPLEGFQWDSIEESLSSYVWDGDFFFIFENDDSPNSDITYIGAFNVARDAWSMQLAPKELSSALLHKFRGRLFCAFLLSDCHGFEVCEIKQTTPSKAATLVEIARTPPQVSREIEVQLEQESDEGDLLAGGSSFCWFICDQGHKVAPLIFDLASNSWYFLTDKEWLSGFSGVLLHQPNLYARV